MKSEPSDGDLDRLASAFEWRFSFRPRSMITAREPAKKRKTETKKASAR